MLYTCTCLTSSLLQAFLNCVCYNTMFGPRVFVRLTLHIQKVQN